MNNTEKHTLDDLLYIAAERAGEQEILEYRESTENSGFSPELLAKMKKITFDGNKSPKKHLNLKYRFLVAAAAALLVCALAIGGIAGRNRDNAVPVLSASGSDLVLTYDTSGFSSGSEQMHDNAPDMLLLGYIKTTQNHSGDSLYALYEKDGVYAEYRCKRLKSVGETVVGNEKTEYFELLINGKYNGIAAITDNTVVVAWNDGSFAYSLKMQENAEEAIEAAEELMNAYSAKALKS